MPVIFPHANQYQISDSDFQSAWHILIDKYGATTGNNDLPRLSTKDSLSKLIQKKQYLSLEYLCRTLVPNGYKNGMQATNIFLNANKHILQPIPTINPISNRKVQGARLIPCTKIKNQSDPDVEALFESDVDELETMGMPSNCVTQPPHEISWGGFVDQFVDEINSSPYQPMYRGKPIGKPVTGWDNRLQAYFWPNPAVGLLATQQRLKPILAKCTKLASLVTSNTTWRLIDQNDAVDVAVDIFKWGGVPQRPETITWQNVWNVFEASLTGKVPSNTPMNSGWTKVAAFATAHLDTGAITPNQSVQVIWDSRVSTSIIRRLDNILKNASLKSLPNGYAKIGRVSGRGGTRAQQQALTYNWRNGYGDWSTQFAGSAFVQEVCTCLNNRRIKMTTSDGKKSNWTIRAVEMVLFGDGY